MNPAGLSLHPLCGLPLFQPGDDLAGALAQALEATTGLEDGDVRNWATFR